MPPLASLDGLHGDLSRRRFLAATAAAGLLTACGSDATSSPAVPATGPWTFTDVEKLAALAPDLVAVPFDPRQDGPPFGFVDGPVQDQVQAIAPIAAIDGIKDPAQVLARFAELAAALSADLQAPAPAAARKRFEDAGSALRAAVAAKPDLLAVAVYATPSEGISFCRPATFPGLRHLQQLGLELVVPEGGASDVNEDFTNFFFDSVSLELAGKYPADLILLDADTAPEVMAGVPTWAALPAVQAGQIASFRRLGSWTYEQNAAEIEAITASLRSANPDLV